MLKIGGQWNIPVRPFPPGFNFEADLLEKEEVHFKVKSSIEERFISMKQPSFGDENYSHSKVQVVRAVGGEIQELSGISSSDREDNLVDIAWYVEKNKLFVFKPERMPLAILKLGTPIHYYQTQPTSRRFYSICRGLGSRYLRGLSIISVRSFRLLETSA